MPESDYGDFDEDCFVVSSTLAGGFFNTEPQFAESPRPSKRRKINCIDGSNDSEIENVAPVSRSAPIHASRLVPPGTSHPGKNGATHGSFSRSQHQSLAQQTSSDSDDSAFDPAPFHPEPLPRTQLKKVDTKPITEGFVNVNSRTGVGRSASRPTELTNHFQADSDSDDAFDPPALPVTNTRVSIRPVQTAAVNQKQATLSFDAAKELEDLPSDAFDLSSPGRQQNDAEWISSGEPASRGGYVRAPQNGLRQTTLFGSGIHAMSSSLANKQLNFPVPPKDEPPTHHKLDVGALKTWVYPTNMGPIRDYQFNIVQRGLFHNLLVALPTGLGKTFIAATIMLNWFRWTTDAQILFVAPTKPLVSQQVQACFGIAGIPRSHTTLLTGETPPGLRAEEWATKRVFFMTPQTVINDLKTGTCNPKRIVLLVVDEAHKATGAYAYVEIVKFIRRFNESFRVLALTATPGSDVESVQSVIDSLDIARVEIRTERSLDIRQYVHSRKVEKFVFENTEEMEMCMDLYSKAVQPVLGKLNGMNAYWCKDPLKITPFGCQQARAQWMASDAGRGAHFGVKGMVNSIFTVLASLSHSMDLLKYHGMSPFYHGLINFQNSLGDKQVGSKYRQQIVQSEHFEKLMSRLKTWCNHPEFIGHPKLEFLRDVVLNHFLDAGEGLGPEGQPPSSTRVMIFAHWRDSAEEIVRILKRNEPMIRSHVFVGQAASKNSEGMDQKRQLEIIHKFKTGVYNTIVATSIGEEGLDIGEVDLIICYDSKASPIRMLQRMGRTGRKRAGKIVLLQMKGKEEDDAAKAKDNYEKMQEMIACGARFSFHDERNRRIIPKDVQPVVDKRNVYIPQENSQQGLPEPKRRPGRQPKRPPKKFHMPDGVRTGFVRASRMEDDDNGEEDNLESLVQPVRDEPCLVPALEEVLLSEKEQRDLDNCYQNVVDGDNLEIQQPSLTSHPARQRRLGKTFAFKKPGRAATEFVAMIKRMRNVDQARLDGWKMAASSFSQATQPPSVPSVDSASSSESPPSDDDEEEVLSRHFAPRTTTSGRGGRVHGRGRRGGGGISTSRNQQTPVARQRSRAAVSAFIADYTADGGRGSSPPGSDPRMRVLSQAISLGSMDTEGEDEEEGDPESELAAFIAGDDEEVEVESSSQLSSWLDASSSVREMSRVQRHRVDDSGEEDDDLPDVATLLGGMREGIVESKGSVDAEDDNEDVLVVRKRANVVRRTVIDDSDELMSS